MSRLARGRPLDHATNHQVSPNCEDLTKKPQVRRGVSGLRVPLGWGAGPFCNGFCNGLSRDLEAVGCGGPTWGFLTGIRWYCRCGFALF